MSVRLHRLLFLILLRKLAQNCLDFQFYVHYRDFHKMWLLQNFLYFFFTLFSPPIDWIQSRVVTGLLRGHNTLRRHLYLLGLSNSPLCRWCEAGEETSAHVLCECEALASRRHAYLGPFFLEPRYIKNLNLGGPSGTATKLQGSHDTIWGTKGMSYLRPRFIGTDSPRNHMQSIYVSIEWNFSS